MTVVVESVPVLKLLMVVRTVTVIVNVDSVEFVVELLLAVGTVTVTVVVDSVLLVVELLVDQ